MATATPAPLPAAGKPTNLPPRHDRIGRAPYSNACRAPAPRDNVDDHKFATLNDDEFALYRQVYAQLKPQAPVPDLVIYLQASPETLIERVRRRGVPYERSIPDDYLARLAETYARFFYQYDASPVLIVNSDNLNFVDQPGDFDLLLQRVVAMRGPREFFSMGS